jgi:hypothetical protein
MPEQGTADSAPVVNETTAQAAQQGDSAEGYYVGTYRTKDDAEKGIREAQLAVNRAFAERDKVKAEYEKVLAEKQVQATTKPVIDRKALAKEIDERGGEGVIDILERTMTETDSVYERKLAEVRKSYDERLETIQRDLRDRDPDYLQHKDKVVELAAEVGLDAVKDRDVLLKMVRKLNGGSDGRPPIPGNSATPTMGRSGNSPSLSEAQIAFLQSNEAIGKLKPDEIKRLAQLNGNGRKQAGRAY